jgi:AcrR family transcriptional regulator
MDTDAMQQETGTRTYDSPLRREQAEGTRHRILDAAASVINEDKDFVVAQVAKRAGVSVRTVYHHFPDREAMLNVLSVRLARQLGYTGPEMPDDLMSFADGAVAIGKRVGANDDLVRAHMSTPAGQATHQHGRARRLEHLRQLADAELADVDPQIAEWLVVIIHQLASSRTWLAMKDEAQLDVAEAAEAVAWAIRTLLESVRGAASKRA